MLQQNVFQWPIPSTDFQSTAHPATQLDPIMHSDALSMPTDAYHHDLDSRLALCFLNTFSALDFDDGRGTTFPNAEEFNLDDLFADGIPTTIIRRRGVDAGTQICILFINLISFSCY
jgi:hypothetical protein